MENWRTGRVMKAWVTVWLLALPAVAGAQAPADVVEYYHLDALGSVRAVSDAAGTVVRTSDYRPFGEGENPSAGTVSARLTGKERDRESGLDYFGARYYASRTGRFTTVDPALDQQKALVDPQRWNRYAYALNNPLKFTDPDGKNPLLIMGAAGSAVFGGWQVYQNLRQGRPWHENVGVEASKGLIVGATLGLAAPALAGATAAEMGVLATTSATIAGPLGTIARGDLDKAMNAGGQTVELVTKLTQSPAAGRALSAAGGEGAQALAAASRTAGNLYMARIPQQQAITLLHRAGLVEIRNTVMNGVRGVEYRFRAEAMEYLSRCLDEIPQ
jgi:RHS repeat-associated protein